jgi:gliding motility-associated lipoprotein GldD
MTIFKALALILLFASCSGSVDYTPKKKTYPRLYFPESDQVKRFESEFCPFTFDVPGYADFNRDSMFFNERIDNPCWYNVYTPALNSTIHLTYHHIEKGRSFTDLVNDMHSMTFTHTIKADFIDRSQLQVAPDVNGVLYEVGGNAASPYQFYLTDSNRHFLRGALYINTAPNIDSLQPVIDFLYNDMMLLIKTFRWVGESD